MFDLKLFKTKKSGFDLTPLKKANKPIIQSRFDLMFLFRKIIDSVDDLFSFSKRFTTISVYAQVYLFD